MPPERRADVVRLGPAPALAAIAARPEPVEPLTPADRPQGPPPAAPAHGAGKPRPGVPRHPLVPVFAVGLPLLALAIHGTERQALITATASVALTLLAAVDLRHRVLPNRIIAPATALVLALQLVLFPGEVVEWLLAGPAAAAFLALPLLIRRDAVGMGDIKLMLLLGVSVGWDVFAAIVIGCVAMLPAAAWLLYRDRSIRGATLPFGPFLALGTLLILFTS